MRLLRHIRKQNISNKRFKGRFIKLNTVGVYISKAKSLVASLAFPDKAITLAEILSFVPHQINATSSAGI